MNKLQAGGNIAIDKTESIDILIRWLPENAAIDVCAFVLNASHKVRCDDDFIFYNQPAAKESFLHLSIKTDRQPSFHIDFSKIPQNVEKIIFAATTSGTLAALSAVNIEIKNLVSFTPALEAMQSLVLAELYLHRQQWKFRAVGQGFKEGLEFLASYYGVSIDNEAPAQIETVPSQQNLVQTVQPIRSSVLKVEGHIQPPPAPHHLNALQTSVKMVKELSWVWVFSSFGVFVLIELFLGGFIGQMVIGRFVPHVLTYQIEVLLMLGSFFIGGAIIGLISPKVRIIEPALAAFLSVLLTLSISFFSPYQFMSFSWTKVIIGGGIAFLLALFGARFGEKISARMGNQSSQEFFGDERK